NNLTSFDITPLSATLEQLGCYNNQITELKLNGDDNVLDVLGFSDNMITSFSYNGTQLSYLSAVGNPISNLELSGHIYFIEIETISTTLDLSGITYGELNVYGSALTHLNLK